MPKVVGWTLTIIICLLLFAAGAILKSSISLLLTGKRAIAIVVGFDSRDNVQSPVFEFFTSAGEKIKTRSRSYTSSHSVKVGDKVSVAYNEKNPADAQLLSFMEFPLIPAGMILGFTAIIIMFWISFIMLSNEPEFSDSFGLLPAVISHFKLNPLRFSQLFVLYLVIPLCGIGSYIYTKYALEMLSDGVKVYGHVIGAKEAEIRETEKEIIFDGEYPMIAYIDSSGTEHIIKGSLIKQLSRLEKGDIVEVIYPVGHPEEGIINAWYELWPPPLFLGFMMFGFIFILIFFVK